MTRLRALALASVVAVVGCVSAQPHPARYTYVYQLDESGRALSVEVRPCWGEDASCVRTTPRRPLAATFVVPSVSDPATTVATWAFDPANTSTCAADGNSCQSTSCGAAGSGIGPCATWAGIMVKLNAAQTYTWPSPQNTTFTQMSAHSSNADPVVARARLRQGTSVTYKCSLPTATTTDTVAAVTARSNASGALFAIKRTTTTAPPVGSFLVDSTVANGARGWIHNTTGFNTYNDFMSQMLQAAVLPSATFNLPFNESVAVSDTISMYTTLTNANIVELRPQIEDYSASAPSNFLYVQNCNIWDPSGTVAQSKADISDGVVIYESSATRTLRMVDSIFSAVDAGCVNCYLRGGLVGGKLNAGHFYRLNGGWMPSTAQFSTQGLGVAIDGNFILENSATLTGASINQMVFGNNITLSLLGVSYIAQVTGGYSGTSLWGLPSQTSILSANGRVGYDDSQGGSAGIFPSTGLNFRTNNLTTSCNSCGSTTQTITCGITVGTGALDTACDSTHFGGQAFSPSGAGSFVSATKGGLN